MSLISEALKTAQRQRTERVGAPADRAFFDGFFPYAESGSRKASARIGILIGGGVLLVAVAIGGVWQLRRSMSRSATVAAHPAVPPLVARPTAPARIQEHPSSVANAGSAPPAAQTSAPASAAPRPTAQPVRNATVALPVAKAPARVVASTDSSIASGRAVDHPPAPASAAQLDAPANPGAPSSDRTPKNGGVQVTLEGAPLTTADALMNQAYAAQVNGDFGTAKSLYERAMAIGPATPALYNNYGALLREQGDVHGAIDKLRLALSLDHSFVKGWINLGAAYESLNDNASAIGAYDAALRLDPNNVATKTNLARQYTLIGQYRDAQRLLDDVLKASPDFPLAHYAMGQMLEAQHDFPGAIREFTRFLDLGGARTQPGLDESLKAHIASLKVIR